MSGVIAYLAVHVEVSDDPGLLAAVQAHEFINTMFTYIGLSALIMACIEGCEPIGNLICHG